LVALRVDKAMGGGGHFRGQVTLCKAKGNGVVVGRGG